MENFGACDALTKWLQFCAGDEKAFTEITRKYHASLHHYGTRFTSNKSLVQDCLQDLYLDMWERRENLKYIIDIKSYLFHSLRNNLIHRLKRQSLFSSIGENEVDLLKIPSPEAEWIFFETEHFVNLRLYHAIELLPKRQREALHLRYYENLSYDEIAQVMGLQRQAVANYIQYGIKKLRKYWNCIPLMLFFMDFY